jgi:hypothetical protein
MEVAHICVCGTEPGRVAPDRLGTSRL